MLAIFVMSHTLGLATQHSDSFLPIGDYTGQTDMDGQDRLLYDNVDIGADEVFPIAGDIDGDGDVDFDDFAYFSGHWLKGI